MLGHQLTGARNAINPDTCPVTVQPESKKTGEFNCRSDHNGEDFHDGGDYLSDAEIANEDRRRQEAIFRPKQEHQVEYHYC